ncbi:MAG TPA: rod shape-determining protein MreC [Flavobacteriales bacterium]|nr:rod shape-determining protein MreC [Flavobacteriales bacterium]
MRDLFRFLHRIRSTLMFIGLMLVSLVLLYNGNAHHRAQAISSSNSVVGTIFSWRKEITDYASLKEVNRKLAEENSRWRNRHISTYTPVEGLFARIHDSIFQQEYRVVAAKVVNSTWHKPKNFLTLNKGSRAGIRADMGVIGTNGIVGIVRETTPSFASVISVLSPEIKTSVQLRRTGHFGLLYWDTNDPATASVIDIAKHARVAVGDTVETRGGDGTFPSGITVGVVESVEDQPGNNYHSIIVHLTEDMTSTGFVYAVDDLQRMERDSVQKAHAQ